MVVAVNHDCLDINKHQFESGQVHQKLPRPILHSFSNGGPPIPSTSSAGLYFSFNFKSLIYFHNSNYPMTEDELLDLVDNDDNVIGTQWRNHVHANNLHNFRVINAFIVNDEGKLWIPRRASTKRLFPNGLDMSVGGHVGAGEGYELTFRRETQEETGINIDKAEWKDLGALSPHIHGVNAFMHVYEIHQNEAPDYNSNDFTEYYWLTPQEIINKIDAGDIAKGDLPILIKHFYLKNK